MQGAGSASKHLCVKSLHAPLTLVAQAAALRALAVLGQNEQVEAAAGRRPIRGRGLRILSMGGWRCWVGWGGVQAAPACCGLLVRSLRACVCVPCACRCPCRRPPSPAHPGRTTPHRLQTAEA